MWGSPRALCQQRIQPKINATICHYDCAADVGITGYDDDDDDDDAPVKHCNMTAYDVTFLARLCVPLVVSCSSSRLCMPAQLLHLSATRCM